MVNFSAAEQQVLTRSAYATLKKPLLAGELTLSPHPKWNLPQKIDWAVDPYKDKNWRHQFHMLRWIEPLRGAAAVGDKNALALWSSIVESWIDNNPTSVAHRADAWANMIDGVRAVQLAMGLALFQHHQDNPLTGKIIRSLKTHGAWLNDERHIAHSNHALHQLEGLFVCGVVIENAEWTQNALSRLEKLAQEQWDHQGINAEGSVAYHRNNYLWWHRVALRLQNAGYDLPEWLKKIENTPVELAHATRPNGSFVPFGDSDDNALAKSIDHPNCKYVTSNGGDGYPPETNIAIYDAGYAYGRSGWGEFERDFTEETFFAFTFGKSKVHGHHDMGQLIYSAQGIDWITDPGKHSYSHEHPMRQHVVKRSSHSLITVEGKERNETEPVTLVRKSIDSSAWDFLLEDNGYKDINLKRRIIYSVSGEYLVVVDTLRSQDEVTATQNWQLSPEIQATQQDSFTVGLKSTNGKEAVLYSSGTKSDISIVEATDSSEDAWVSRTWKQAEKATAVRFQKTGQKLFRFITVIAAGHKKAPSVATLRGLSKGLFGLLVENGTVSEKIIVTADKVSIFSAQLSEEEINTQLATDSSPSQKLAKSPKPHHLNQEARDKIFNKIIEAKSLAYEATNASERKEIAQDLMKFQRSVTGASAIDLGLKAAVSDILESSSQKPVYKDNSRTGLINWDDKQNWTPTFYKFPVNSYQLVEKKKNISKAAEICTFDFGEFQIPVLYVPGTGDNLTVFMHGALDRDKTALPTFQRVSSSSQLPESHHLFISDPTLDLSQELRLGWYIGSEKTNLHEAIASVIEQFQRLIGAQKLVLTGNSGGGFAALQIGIHFPDSTIVAFSPQTDIRKYFAAAARRLYEASWGRRNAPQVLVERARLSVPEKVSIHKQIGKIVLVGNSGDIYHINEHEQPLIDALTKYGLEEKLHRIILDLGNGHKSPSANQYIEIIRNVYKGKY